MTLPAVMLVLAAAGKPAAAPKRAVTPVSPAGYAAAVVAPHRGRVLVVNFWATWCEPCREELPSLVAAWKESKGVFDVVLVSADSARLKDTVVPVVLDGLGVPFPCYLEEADDPAKFIDAVDPKWEGELPHTIVYDRRGKPAAAAAGLRTKAQFEKMVAAARSPRCREAQSRVARSRVDRRAGAAESRVDPSGSRGRKVASLPVGSGESFSPESSTIGTPSSIAVIASEAKRSPWNRPALRTRGFRELRLATRDPRRSFSRSRALRAAAPRSG